jgi:hypothetical protein
VGALCNGRHFGVYTPPQSRFVPIFREPLHLFKMTRVVAGLVESAFLVLAPDWKEMISLSKASRLDLNKLDVRCRRGMAAKAAIRLLTAMSMSAVLGLGMSLKVSDHWAW